jgi:potassium-transporting ATPase KdpC subunit
MRRQLLPAFLTFAAFTIIVGVLYPLAITGVSQLVFSAKANGSLVKNDGVVVGSSLIGQSFTAAKYFHSRPSAAGNGYDATSSSPSNLGPSNPVLIKGVRARIAAYRHENGLAAGARVPVEAVTSSASGLDPHISRADALIQAVRVAKARDLSFSQVIHLVDSHTDGRSLGFLGEPGVNVLELNLALDRAK